MTSYVVRPRRISARPPAMIDFATNLGLQRVDEGGAGSAATFAGASGLLSVDAATAAAAGPVGRTALSLVTADVEAAARELTERGLQARVWAQGDTRKGSVRGPAGLSVELDEGRFADADLRDQLVAASMNVVAVCLVSDFDREADFFACFGFHAIEDGSGYLPLTAGRRAGVIGLRQVGEATGRGRDHDRLDPAYEVELAVEASEPFDALAARMVAAGYPAEIVQDETGSWIAVTDPDGAVLVVRPTR